MSGGFDCACFMGVDMSRLGGDHCLIRAQGMRNHSQIGDGAAGKKMNICLFFFYQTADQICSLTAIGICSISYILFSTHGKEIIENPGMGTFTVII